MQVIVHEPSASHVTGCGHDPATAPDPQLTLQLPASERQDTLPRQTKSLSQVMLQLPVELHVTAFPQVLSAAQSISHVPPSAAHDKKPTQAPKSRQSMSQSPSTVLQSIVPAQLPSPQSSWQSAVSPPATPHTTFPAQLLLSQFRSQLSASQLKPAAQEASPMQST